jgi:hypothetical protein
MHTCFLLTIPANQEQCIGQYIKNRRANLWCKLYAKGATATDQQQNQPVSLLPAVPPIYEEERNKVIDAYLQGIPRREICSYLRWGNAKYTTIVKPVLDAYREQEHQTGNVEAQT